MTLLKLFTIFVKQCQSDGMVYMTDFRGKQKYFY